MGVCGAAPPHLLSSLLPTRLYEVVDPSQFGVHLPQDIFNCLSASLVGGYFANSLHTDVLCLYSALVLVVFEDI